jgi:hypothetical protein
MDKVEWWRDPNNPKAGLVVGLSLCCAVSISAIPACMGDPEMYLCQACREFALAVWVPIWEEVSKGTHRKIVYDKIKIYNMMEWQELTRANYPEFGVRVFVAQFRNLEGGDGFNPLEENPLVTAGTLVNIDKDGFHFDGGDSLILNNTYRMNKQQEKFVPTHFCVIQKPGLKV